MRGAIATMTLLAATGCTVSRMAGFDTFAQSGAFERVDITGVPALFKGSFKVGSGTGTVQRLGGSDAIGWGTNRIGSAFDNVRVGLAARFGTIAFTVTSPDLDGELEGRCRYARTEARDSLLGVDIASARRPLTLECAYRLAGQDAGWMNLSAVPSRNAIAEPRRGRIEFAGQSLDIRSSHDMEHVPVKSDLPMGYFLSDSGGRDVAAIENDGGSARRMLLPRGTTARAPALAAMVTLALFWDPGNVG